MLVGIPLDEATSRYSRVMKLLNELGRQPQKNSAREFRKEEKQLYPVASQKWVVFATLGRTQEPASGVVALDAQI